MGGGAPAGAAARRMMVRDAVAGDEAGWRRLWAGYLAHYGQTLPEAMTAHTWARALDPASAIGMRVVEREDGAIVGFAVRVLHPSTWDASDSCYLEDLFVDPAARGRGVARALIDDLIAQARAKGWSHVYWVTEQENARARLLYDSYAPADGYVRYRLALA